VKIILYFFSNNGTFEENMQLLDVAGQRYGQNLSLLKFLASYMLCSID